jgi:hypothetical protein
MIGRKEVTAHTLIVLQIERYNPTGCWGGNTST